MSDEKVFILAFAFVIVAIASAVVVVHRIGEETHRECIRATGKWNSETQGCDARKP